MTRDVSDEGRGKNRKEQAWLVVGLLLCLILCGISLGLLNVKRGAGLFPISISSNRVANYGSEKNSGDLRPISLDIIGDVIRDQNPQVTNVAGLVSTVRANLRTPVPTVTPWSPGGATQVLETSATESWTASHTPGLTHTGSITALVTRTVTQTLTTTGTHLLTPSWTPTRPGFLTPTRTETPLDTPIHTDTRTATPLHTPTTAWSFTATPSVTVLYTTTHTAVLSGTPTQTSTPSSTLSATSTTYTPTFPPADLVIQIINPTSGQVINKRSETRFKAEAYDPTVGNVNGSGISSVLFTLYNSANEVLFSLSDNDILFCAFGDDGDGNCEQMSNDTLWEVLIDGNYSLTATAYAIDGRSNSTTVTFSIVK